MAGITEEASPYLGVTYFVLCLVGIFGNSLTLFILITRPTFKNRNQIRLFFGNLAVADLASCSLWLIVALGYIDRKIADSNIICIFSAVSRRPVQTITVLSLTLLCINRYYFIVKENKAEVVFSKSRSLMYVTGIWIFSCLSTSLPFLWGGKILSYSHTVGACTYNDNVSILISATVSTSCIFTIMYCNLKTWYTVKRHNRSLVDANVITASTSRVRNAKLARIVFFISFLFIITYSPTLVLFIIKRGAKKDMPAFWSRFLFTGYVFNFSNNVFVYSVMDIDYRNEIKRFFLKICRINSVFSVDPLEQP